MNEKDLPPVDNSHNQVMIFGILAVVFSAIGFLIGMFFDSMPIFGIGLLAGGLWGLIAVVWGVDRLIFAIKDRRKYGKVVLGILLGLVPIVIFFSLPPLGVVRPPAKHAVSMSNLNGIGKALLLYHSSYEAYPDQLELLITCGYSSAKMFQNPMGEDTVELDNASGKFVGHVGYIFILPQEGMPPDTIIGYEKEQYAYGGKVVVLLFNGTIIDMPVNKLHARLAKQKAEKVLPAE